MFAPPTITPASAEEVVVVFSEGAEVMFVLSVVVVVVLSLLSAHETRVPATRKAKARGLIFLNINFVGLRNNINESERFSDLKKYFSFSFKPQKMGSLIIIKH